MIETTLRRAVLALATLMISTLSVAESAKKWAIGLGIEYQAEFPGANKSSFGPSPMIERLAENEPFYTDLQAGARIGFSDKKELDYGIAIHFNGGRDRSDVPIELETLDEVDLSVELGAFAEWRPDALGVRLDLLRGLGGHKGWILSPALVWFSDEASTIRWNAAVGGEWASNRYMDAFFAVRPNQASASLGAFEADAGFSNSFVRVGMAWDLHSRWVFSGLFGVRTWLGDAKDSPVVKLGEAVEPHFEAGVMVVF